MSPSAAVAQLLSEAMNPVKRALEELGITVTVDASTDKLTGNVVCSYQFVVKKATAERLASESV